PEQRRNYRPPRGICHLPVAIRAQADVGFHSGRPAVQSSARETTAGTSTRRHQVSLLWDHPLKVVAISKPGLVSPSVPAIWPQAVPLAPAVEPPVRSAN